MELLIVVAILMIIGAIAIPRINTALMNAKEMAAIRELQNLNTAQVQYMSHFGRYAANLTELGPPSTGQANPNGADLVTKEMANGAKNGYKFVMQTAQVGGYAISSTPLTFGSTGRRSFYTDASGVIRQNWGAEPATNASEELK